MILSYNIIKQNVPEYHRSGSKIILLGNLEDNNNKKYQSKSITVVFNKKPFVKYLHCCSIKAPLNDYEMYEQLFTIQYCGEGYFSVQLRASVASERFVWVFDRHDH